MNDTRLDEYEHMLRLRELDLKYERERSEHWRTRFEETDKTVVHALMFGFVLGGVIGLVLGVWL